MYDKQKQYLKNQQWKKKYKKKACGSVEQKSTKPIINKESKKEEEEEEADQADLVPKQVLPLNGWFPEFDDSSTSSDDDFESLVTSLNLSKPKDSNTECPTEFSSI
ncbi:uncharacterized protein LOC111694684 [Trichogramma pretiosum]|uniref:uncharacterized protein LOC111694684 n=1 Tax=Trichogramma pretiosum TaxID=7493 RepID=UPI000C71B304|nr:uncharacterized protein LOC111694684 [Trichogramma pretiosum]